MMKKTSGAKKPTKMAYGKKVEKMKSGKMPMVKGKDGEMVPKFAADGVGKMAYGGKVKKMQEGKRTRRPAPVEEPVSKNVLIQAMEEDRRIAEANEKVQKKRGGGMCRGMGAATKGGNYKAS